MLKKKILMQFVLNVLDESNTGDDSNKIELILKTIQKILVEIS